jgi:hypothetical protein
MLSTSTCHSLGDYGGVLKRRVANDQRYWAQISGCLKHGHPCNDMSPLVRDPNTGALLPERTKFWPIQVRVSISSSIYHPDIYVCRLHTEYIYCNLDAVSHYYHVDSHM